MRVVFACLPLSLNRKSDIKALGHKDMSAQHYNRIPSVPTHAPSSRRHPLSNAPVNQPVGQLSPSKVQEAVKAPASPPLPRQNTKTTPPSPPKIITDKSRAVNYQRVGFLGEVWSFTVGRSLGVGANKSTGGFCSCVRSKRCTWY